MATHEDLDRDRELGDEFASKIGRFAIRKWKGRGASKEKGIINDGRDLSSMLYSYASVEKIEPPEAAVLRLSDRAQKVTAMLLSLALELRSKHNKLLRPDSEERIRQIIAYANGSAEPEVTINNTHVVHDIPRATSDTAAEKEPEMTLRQVGRVEGTKADDLSYIEALGQVWTEMEGKPL